MQEPRVIISSKKLDIVLSRLCYELIETYGDFDNVCLIGIQNKGAILAERLFERMKELADTSKLEFGKLDVTFYRDDFRKRKEVLKAFPTEMDFIVEKKCVVLIDDVLYTGRTINAALAALQHYGRPEEVKLLCLVDRRYNRDLPISANFTGVKVDSLDEAYVNVTFAEKDGEDKIELYSKK